MVHRVSASIRVPEKQRLIEAPVLAYPSFSREFVLETDASIEGLGAVLSQAQGDGRLHPIAFASRALSQAERNYSINLGSGLGRLAFPLLSLQPGGDSVH